VNKTTIRYDLQPMGHSKAYYPGGDPSGSPPRYANPLNLAGTTVVPSRIPASLVMPLDYARVYNVADAYGRLRDRRYVGEPRFFALVAWGSNTMFERVAAGIGSIVFGLLSLAAVHASLPHNTDGHGNLISTAILPGWVKLLMDVLGILAIASSVGAILTAKEQ